MTHVSGDRGEPFECTDSPCRGHNTAGSGPPQGTFAEHDQDPEEDGHRLEIAGPMTSGASLLGGGGSPGEALWRRLQVPRSPASGDGWNVGTRGNKPESKNMMAEVCSSGC